MSFANENMLKTIRFEKKKNVGIDNTKFVMKHIRP